MFVACSAQKAGGVGSEFFSRSIDPSKIVAAINMDVIGKASQFGPESAYITGYKESSLPNILRDYAPGKFKFRPDPYKEADLFKQSDNFPLAQLGVPAHTVSTFQLGADPYYNGARSEERRVGQECVSTGSSLGSPLHSNINHGHECGR